jgi:peroxiredoxin
MLKINSSKIRSVWSHLTLLTILLVCSVAVNVMLARKTKRLEASLDRFRSGKHLPVGLSVPPIELLSMNGTLSKISYSETTVPTVLYFFSTSCKWCDLNSQNIKFMGSSLKDNYRFIGICLDRDLKELSQYVSRNELPFPIYHTPSSTDWTTYKLGGTPQTIVVSPEGKVLEEWSSAYSLDSRVAVESFFKINLPGIKPISLDASSETLH